MAKKKKINPERLKDFHYKRLLGIANDYVIIGPLSVCYQYERINPIRILQIFLPSFFKYNLHGLLWRGVRFEPSGRPPAEQPERKNTYTHVLIMWQHCWLRSSCIFRYYAQSYGCARDAGITRKTNLILQKRTTAR